MKKILIILFLFLSSFCFTSCTESEEKIFQAGYNYVYVTLPTKVTEDFELLSYYRDVFGCDIHYNYVSHNTDIIRIENKIAHITRSNQDVDVSIECIIRSICCIGISIKTITVTVVGLENDVPTSSTQE